VGYLRRDDIKGSPKFYFRRNDINGAPMKWEIYEMVAMFSTSQWR
jgi:hypothetical protein